MFIMHGARAAIAGGMTHIEEQVKALEQAVCENAGLAFDLAKTLIESTCKTIITGRGGSYENTDDLAKLFKHVSQIVPFLPAGFVSGEDARKSLLQTLNGLNTALMGVCELRNAFGFASHGSDGDRPKMGENQALLAAQAADAIIGFIHGVHRDDLGRSKTTRPSEYSDFGDFNDWIDEQSEPVTIMRLPPYRPSEVLFRVDQEAYHELLTDYRAEETEESSVREEVTPP